MDRVAADFFRIGACFASPASRCWASPEVTHLPCLVMPRGTTSYLVLSMDLRMEAAERREISCSPERPPKRMPMRSFLLACFSGCFAVLFVFVLFVVLVVMDRYKFLLNLAGWAGKSFGGIDVVFIGVLRI